MTYDDYIAERFKGSALLKRAEYNNLRKRYGYVTLLRWKRMKRKRTGTTYTSKPPFKKRAYFRKGFDRTGGNWGRYSGRNSELKFHDLDIDDAVIAAAGTITPSCNLIAQGVTESERVGRKCVIRNIHWKYNITLPITSGNGISANDTIRVILYKDKQCNGAAATISGTAGILATADYQSYRNLTETGRYLVIMDKIHTFNFLAAAGDGTANDAFAVNRNFTFNKTCNIPLEFDSTTGVITEIRSNNVGVLLLSKTGVCAFDSKMRIRFSDGS